MNLATAPDRAHRATRKGAARLHNDLNYELALGDHSPEHRERGERALSILEERFPGIADEAANVTDPPQLSRHARTELEHETTGGERRSRAPREPRRGPARRRAGGRRAARQTTGRALQLADTASGGWSTSIGDVFVWAAGLSIFYLLITKAAATGKLALGASNIVRAVVSPHVDPLNPKGIA